LGAILTAQKVPPGAGDADGFDTLIVPAWEALSADTRPVSPLPHRWIEA
jgi:hypothetical protein